MYVYERTAHPNSRGTGTMQVSVGDVAGMDAGWWTWPMHGTWLYAPKYNQSLTVKL